MAKRKHNHDRLLRRASLVFKEYQRPDGSRHVDIQPENAQVKSDHTMRMFDSLYQQSYLAVENITDDLQGNHATFLKRAKQTEKELVTAQFDIAALENKLELVRKLVLSIKTESYGGKASDLLNIKKQLTIIIS